MGEAIFLKKISLSQQMAHEHDAGKEQVPFEVPPQFQRYKKVFSEEEAKRFPPDRAPFNVEIKLKKDAPDQLNCKIYPLTKQETETLRKYVDEELEKGFITEGASPYTSPVFFIAKKDSDEKRLVIDYRRLNEITERDNGPLPRIDEIWQKLEGKALFSKFDIRRGYNNVIIEPKDRYKAAFKTPIGTYIPNVLQFGQANGPAQWMRLMYHDFKTFFDIWGGEHRGTTGLCYMDDFVVASKPTREGSKSHDDCCHHFLTICWRRRYTLKPSKCVWRQTKIIFLGVLVEDGVLSVDPAKREGISKWPVDLKDRHDVQRTMGMLQYQRQFIPGFSYLARPIFETLKKGQIFHWTSEAREALKRIIKIITDDPKLQQPDPNQPFEMEIDASKYATGAVLIQRGKDGARIEVGYHSKALTPTERRYDVYDRECLALVRAFKQWRHLLEGHPHKIKVWTDHANLARFREGQALSDKHKRYSLFLTRFDFDFYHIPGKQNITADALSRRSDLQPPEGEEPKEVLFPDHMFIKLIRPVAMEENIKQQHSSTKYKERLQQWEQSFNLNKKYGLYWKEGALVVPNYENIGRGLLEVFHDGLTAGHPGQLKTWLDLKRHYWWPSMRKMVQEYVQGCAICQANKIITHRNKPPLFPISPEDDAQPFEVVAMDLIVKLPESQGYDSILTITDHDCTKGVILVPCKEEMTAEQLAGEYKSKVFPYAGIPKKIISDRDTRFTSKFAKEVCAQLQIKQNISTAYHPQTDGQSEKTNQHVETLLRIFCNFQQNDWASHLPIVQYILNARVSSTTKKAPFELWMGHIPRAHQPDRLSKVPRVEWHKEQIQIIRDQAKESMKRAQELWAKEKLRAFLSRIAYY